MSEGLSGNRSRPGDRCVPFRVQGDANPHRDGDQLPDRYPGAVWISPGDARSASLARTEHFPGI